MLSSRLEFPKDDLLAALRENYEKIDPFVKQTTKHNTEWTYQSIKHIHNVLIEGKENPSTKLNALKMIQALVQTCEIPCLNLIEVYILPIIFSVSAYKPQQTGERRGFRFFIDSGYSPRIPAIEDIGIQFVALSTQILYACSAIRTKRILECEQLNQQSQFVESYNKLKGMGVTDNITNKKLKFIKEEFLKKAREKYLKKLTNFQNISESYTQYFVVRMVQSLQIQQNPLFSNSGKTVTSLSTDLDFKRILKYGDTFITSPLIQQLLDGLQTSENFVVKKNFLSLLSDFVKWADVQAFVQINYQETINQIGIRISEVAGEKSLDAGENIFPEIKGQKDAKKKFYVEFLKSLQVWTICMKNALDSEEPSMVEELYIYFKVEKKFKFPENLFLKKIEDDFKINEQKNRQKNAKIYEKLRLDQTSVVNTKKSINKKSIRKTKESKIKKVSFKGLKDLLEECYDDFDTLFDDMNEFEGKMKKLLKFKDNFEADLENIDTQPSEDEILAVLDDGDTLIDHILAIEPYYKDYKSKKITIQDFSEKVNAYLERLDSQFESSQNKTQNFSQSQSISGQNESKSSYASKKLIMSKSKSKQFLNSSQEKKEKLLTSNSKLIRKPENILEKGKLEKVESSIDKKENQSKILQILKRKDQSKVSENDSGISSSKIKLKMSRISNNFSNASQLKKQPQLSEKKEEAKEISNHEKSQVKQNVQNESIEKSQFSMKSRMKNLISIHRSNRTNRSQQFEFVKNSTAQNDFSRDIKNIVYRDLIVNKKIGVKEEGLNIIEKVGNIIEGQNQSVVTNSRISKKRSLLKNSQKKSKKSPQNEKIGLVSKEQNDEYMMSKMTSNKKLQSINSQQNLKISKNSDLKHSSSVSNSSKFKLKKQISRKSKNQDSRIYHQVKNEESENQDHYQMRLQVQEKKPEMKEEEEQSYYGIESLENKNKKQKVFEVRKQTKNSFLKSVEKANQYALFKSRDKLEGDYLMMKLRKQQLREKDQDLKGMESRIMRLRNETSRIRRELSARSKGSLSKRSNSNNTSHHSKNNDFISSERSHRFSESIRSFSKGKSSHTSKQSIKSIEGACFKVTMYDQYFNQNATNYVKKTFLKPKTLLHNDESIEIGAICRYQETLKIILFITPSEEIHEFRYKITEQLTLSMKNYPQYYPKIPEKKQVKINLSAQLKSMPFVIPQININYIQRGKQKTLNLVLPCPPHRFIQFSNVNPGQLTATFDHDSNKIIRTDEFRVNKSIFKVDKMMEYFQNLTLIRKQNTTNTYGVQGHFKRESFLLKIMTKGSSRMVVQGVPKSRPQFLEYILSSLRFIISDVQ